jgi:hypothetical protein
MITQLIRMRRPALAINPCCKAGKKLRALSNTGCGWSLVRGRIASCSPRYLIGKPVLDRALNF